jgi:hypothetical protein
MVWLFCVSQREFPLPRQPSQRSGDSISRISVWNLFRLIIKPSFFLAPPLFISPIFLVRGRLELQLVFSVGTTFICPPLLNSQGTGRSSTANRKKLKFLIGLPSGCALSGWRKCPSNGCGRDSLKRIGENFFHFLREEPAESCEYIYMGACDRCLCFVCPALKIDCLPGTARRATPKGGAKPERAQRKNFGTG